MSGLIVQSKVKNQSKELVLHLTELRLNSQLTVAPKVAFLLGFRGDKSIADVDHRLDLQSEVGEFCPQTIDVNV